MSIQKKENSNDQEFDNQSPLIILKNENNNLGDELNRINNLITKLKTQIAKNEQEKSILISNNKKKEKNFQEILKILEEENSQLSQLKNKELELKLGNNNDIQALQKKNDILKEEKDKNNSTIAELQKKITDLEMKLKLSEKKIFTSLSKGKNESIEINKIQYKEKKNISANKHKLNSISKEYNSNENIDNDGKGDSNDVSDLNEAKNRNQKLKENISKLQEEFNKIDKEKNNLLEQINQYNNDKNKLVALLKEKNEAINEKINNEKQLNEDINKQLNENIKIKNNINALVNKCKSLLKNKNILEDTVIQQENKVDELTKSINEIMKIISKKETQINHDKLYISDLKQLIKELKMDYHNQIKNKQSKNYQKELKSLNAQLNYLKKGAHNIININNINNKNYYNYDYNNINNNSINILHKSGNFNFNRNNADEYNKSFKSNKRYINFYNNKSLSVKKNKNKPVIINNDNISKIPLIQKYKIENYLNKQNKINVSQKNNQSLPNVEGYRNNINLKNYLINEAKTNLKSQIINKRNYRNELQIPKIDNRHSRNIPRPKLNFPQTHDIEKQKIEEVKDLIDKIVSEFD